MPSNDKEAVRLDKALLDCVRQFEHEPNSAAVKVLEMACRAVSAEAGRLLILAAESGELETIATFFDNGATQAADEPFWPAREQASYPRTRNVAAGTIQVPAIRGNMVVGAVEIKASGLDDDQLLFLNTVAEVLPLARANRVLHAGLQRVPPIPDTDGDEISFRASVYRYLETHTRTALTCIYHVQQSGEITLLFGPTDGALVGPLDSEEVILHVLDAALRAPGIRIGDGLSIPGMATFTTIGYRPTSLHLGQGASNAEPDGQSAEDVYVLLAGFGFDYEPSPSEIAALQYSVGLAAHLHAVYGHIHDVAGKLGQVAEIGSAITSIEITQKARHHAFTQIDLAQHLLLDLKRSPKSDELLKKLSLALSEVSADLLEMKSAARAPERERYATQLKPIWISACAQVQHRLGNRIRTHYDGPDVDVIAAPDWFRQVFLNLLLNSLDAFGASSRSGRITLTVDRPSLASGQVRLTYSDDATGIMPQHFLKCDVAEDMNLPERIFVPGVTSKSGGSGWGLHICRSIVHAHRGSIDLEHGRRGVTFRITLPMAETTQ